MQVSLPSVGSEQEINRALLTDLIIVRHNFIMIYPYMATYYKLLFPWQHDVTLSSHTQAVLGAEETSYDQYKAFKLFESFPEVDTV